MQTKKETSNNLIKYVVGGLGFLAIGAGTYYLIKKLKENRPRERTVRILNELRKEMYPFLKQLAYKSKNVPAEMIEEPNFQEFKEEMLRNGTSKSLFIIVLNLSM